MKRVLASLIFFTRLPLWRFVNVPSCYFKRVVELWPLVGWLTGGITALVLYLASMVFSLLISILLAITARILLTGALHEDGLADFCDGMGGGSDRNRILAIMKDSHIGTYGVIGLILYFLLLTGAWLAMPMSLLCFVVLAGDCWSKFCAGQIINFLPYARKEEESKSKIIYQRFGIGAWILSFLIAVVPFVFLPVGIYYAAIAPIIIVAVMILIMRKRLGGYTGDCCGATFLLSELAFYLTASAIWN